MSPKGVELDHMLLLATKNKLYMESSHYHILSLSDLEMSSLA